MLYPSSFTTRQTLNKASILPYFFELNDKKVLQPIKETLPRRIAKTKATRKRTNDHKDFMFPRKTIIYGNSYNKRAL